MYTCMWIQIWETGVIAIFKINIHIIFKSYDWAFALDNCFSSSMHTNMYDAIEHCIDMLLICYWDVTDMLLICYWYVTDMLLIC